MDQLIQGYRKFRQNVWPDERARYQALAKMGQSPDALVISCSDSRVDPQSVFGAVPGQLFVVRNVAGLVPPYSPDGRPRGTSAALEFGVRVLKVPKVVVLGHAQCGGVRAMVEGAPAEARDFVEPWMKIAQPVLDRGRMQPGCTDPLTYYEMEVLRLSLAHLRTFPWIEDAVQAGRLELCGFRFDIHTGILEQMKDDRLVPVE
ncbi:MAG TPA: carbonic anhydrase [Geminicoccus sp.]|uniref:carbonic anhydrase n=1 Tax=Geminicoccus sp. TaxID=2024832 RepID=UPI002E380126|nr:carbonic anhydrase [Geminicoccus sp.]HEX2525261.1 carbonic anhydrase [Geminicoccus sp.]